MEMQSMNAQAAAGQYRMKRAVVVTAGTLLFLVVAAVAYMLCTFQLKYITQEILNNQRDMQQAWVDKSLEAIHAWRNNLVVQSRFISSAEMFRLLRPTSKIFLSKTKSVSVRPMPCTATTSPSLPWPSKCPTCATFSRTSCVAGNGQPPGWWAGTARC